VQCCQLVEIASTSAVVSGCRIPVNVTLTCLNHNRLIHICIHACSSKYGENRILQQSMHWSCDVDPMGTKAKMLPWLNLFPIILNSIQSPVFFGIHCSIHVLYPGFVTVFCKHRNSSERLCGRKSKRVSP